MLTRSCIALALSLCLFPITSLTAQPDRPPLPAHEQLLQKLRAGTDVRPPTPDQHPVSITYNREAIVPPQCYTRTEGRHNPCYVCHQAPLSQRENTMADGDLQIDYSFSDLGMTNHWNNLFEDRSARIAKIGDDEIRRWVDQDNYSELAPRLRAAGFQGWIPDLAGLERGAEVFDHEGFAKDGSLWVAFNYKPFPSTFWPTNGSTDDVMIRLAKPYRSDAQGNYSREVYRANLAIVEANIKGVDGVSVTPIDERAVGSDLDGNGTLASARYVRRATGYVGAAKGYFIDLHLYPAGTEFLHTVRYIGTAPNGDITLSRRMKEVRYMLKAQAVPRFALAEHYREEGYAKEAGYLPGYTRLGDKGLDNGMGWAIQSFIEDRHGRLRAATYEENLFCMGCHNSIGTTIDKTFSFARKIDGAAGWGYIDLKGMPDAPNVGETRGEIATYLQRTGGGSEFRNNPEMAQRWFNADGSVNERALSGKDVYTLITPSVERALLLNKAYRVIVEDQDYIYGRDATAQPPVNVYDKIDNDKTPTLPANFIYQWDIRLAWPAAESQPAAVAKTR